VPSAPRNVTGLANEMSTTHGIVNLRESGPQWLNAVMNGDSIAIPPAGQEHDPALAYEWLCGSCPLRSPHRRRKELPTGLGPAPTVAQARRRLSVDWTPLTARTRGRITLAIRSADFRSRMAPVLGFVQSGDMRLVLLRQRLPVAAIVPLPDFWFLLQVEEELRRLGWPAHRRQPRPEAIARAIIDLQPPDPRPRASRAAGRPQQRESAPWLTYDDVDALRGRH
jgi:antitoxin (DNA-binding transcriptional repressor) of toxin-antitoxin stability system